MNHGRCLYGLGEEMGVRRQVVSRVSGRTLTLGACEFVKPGGYYIQTNYSLQCYIRRASPLN
jgi:hypothetical protein